MRPERDLRRQLVKACAALSARGLVAATDGNCSARLGAERFLCTPSEIAKGEIREADLVICDAQARKLGGPKGAKVSSEIRVHLAAYRVRPECGAVVHAHPPVASAFGFAGQERWLSRPVIPEVVAQLGPIPTVPYVTPGTQKLADAAAKAFRRAEVVLLAQHGAVALGADPWQAYLRMEKLEHAATILKHVLELARLSGGRVRSLTRTQVQELRRLYGA